MIVRLLHDSGLIEEFRTGHVAPRTYLLRAGQVWSWQPQLDRDRNLGISESEPELTYRPIAIDDISALEPRRVTGPEAQAVEVAA